MHKSKNSRCYMEYRNIRKTGEKGKTEHTGKTGNKKNMGKLRKWEN